MIRPVLRTVVTVPLAALLALAAVPAAGAAPAAQRAAAGQPVFDLLDPPGPVRAGREERPDVPAEGSYVRAYNDIFRIVGGAPLYVSTWNNVPRGPVTEIVDDRMWNRLRWFPRDGTFVTATDGKVYRFVAGAPLHVTTWAVYGGPRPSVAVDSAAIAHAGQQYPYDAVLARPYDVGPRWNTHVAAAWVFVQDYDGSVFVSTQKNRVYKLVGGAPVYVSTWAAFGGPRPTVRVDQATIDRAGQAAPFNFLRKHPPDGVVLKAAQSGQVFVTAGGAPLYVPDLRRLTTVWPGRVTAAVVDQYAIDRAGQALPADNLRLYPKDGTWLLGADQQSSLEYQVRGGRPVAARDPLGQWVLVSQAAIDHAGGPPPWNHLLAP